MMYCSLKCTSVQMDVCLVCTHRAIQFSLAVHGEVETTVNTSDANQTHSQTDELQNTCTQIHTLHYI